MDFEISPTFAPSVRYRIRGAFTSPRLGLAERSYPVAALQERYRHLRDLPLTEFEKVTPLLLIGADNHHLLLPVGPVKLGPPGSPAAVQTLLGWGLQGTDCLLDSQRSVAHCLFTDVTPVEGDVYNQAGRLSQVNFLSSQDKKLVSQSRQDAEAVRLLEPLRETVAPPVAASGEVMLPALRSVVRRPVAPGRTGAHGAEESRVKSRRLVRGNRKYRLGFDRSLASHGRRSCGPRTGAGVIPTCRSVCWRHGADGRGSCPASPWCSFPVPHGPWRNHQYRGCNSHTARWHTGPRSRRAWWTTDPPGGLAYWACGLRGLE